ncbi:hypothetical protein FWC63_00885 [Candidatus Saccharibacteria bacterium]|nr:hypothetical protein [Candidatus Saccharibacteria bacterium]
MSSVKRRTLRGDTIVEVLFAVAIFGVVAMVAIQMMNRGIAIAQTAIESQQARNEMDAQAAAINFIHNGFLAERGLPEGIRQFEDLWDRLVASPRLSAPLLHPADSSCEFIMTSSSQAAGAFVVNTRALQHRVRPDGSPNPNYNVGNIIRRHTQNPFIVAPIYPRIVYSGTGQHQIATVEGLQVFAVQSANLINGQPEFFDFHIRACWRPAGAPTDSRLSTIVRMLNPRVVE